MVEESLLCVHCGAQSYHQGGTILGAWTVLYWRFWRWPTCPGTCSSSAGQVKVRIIFLFIKESKVCCSSPGVKRCQMASNWATAIWLLLHDYSSQILDGQSLLLHSDRQTRDRFKSETQITVVILTRGKGLPYIRYIGMCRQRVWFLGRFGLKTGIDFEHCGLKLGMVIGGTFTKAYKLIFLPATGASNWRERKRNR